MWWKNVVLVINLTEACSHQAYYCWNKCYILMYSRLFQTSALINVDGQSGLSAHNVISDSQLQFTLSPLRRLLDSHADTRLLQKSQMSWHKSRTLAWFAFICKRYNKRDWSRHLNGRLADNMLVGNIKCIHGNQWLFQVGWRQWPMRPRTFCIKRKNWHP